MKIKASKNIENRFLGLKYWCATVRSLYPSVRTENPYTSLLGELELPLYLTSEQAVRLHKNLVHCITLVNQLHRLELKYKVIESTREDNLNAVQLLYKVSRDCNMLCRDLLKTHKCLKDHFNNHAFTFNQAYRKTLMARSTLHRHLISLYKHGYLDRSTHKQPYQWQITEKEPLKEDHYNALLDAEIPKEPTNAFDVMHQEFSNYKGYEELQYRTGYSERG